LEIVSGEREGEIASAPHDDGDEFREQVRAQYEMFGRVIREAGIKVE